MTTILIVDDTRTIRFQLSSMLSKQGFDVLEAGDGSEALRSVDRTPPDLILLDIMMPNVDGIECCRTLKSNKATAAIKIVMISTKSEFERVKEAFAAGCDGYLIKPIDESELLKKIKEMTQLSRARKDLQDVITRTKTR